MVHINAQLYGNYAAYFLRYIRDAQIATAAFRSTFNIDIQMLPPIQVDIPSRDICIRHGFLCSFYLGEHYDTTQLEEIFRNTTGRSEIGSMGGMTDPEFFKELCEVVSIPVIAEGGLKSPEDAYTAMALGAGGVLVNKAIFEYNDPFQFIHTLNCSISAGRKAYLCNLSRIRRN